MQLEIDENGWNCLSETIEAYYKKQGRTVSIFSAPMPKDINALEFCFLIDRKHVAKYTVGMDRNVHIGLLLLAIGPHYFSPADFWDYSNFQRFTLEASTDSVVRNLKLLDEFLGSF